MKKQSLFISYCWSDGTFYADEIERQLKDTFDVKRDKSSLGCNDAIDDFMRKIAECDNVVLILTKNYFESINCMTEVAYLSKQLDWANKSILLVVDTDLYDFEVQSNLIKSWNIKKNELSDNKSNYEGKRLYAERMELITSICDQIEGFLIELKRRNNPSQISIINDIIRLSKRNRTIENEMINNSVKTVQELIENKGNVTLSEIEKETGYSKEVAHRAVGALSDKYRVDCNGSALFFTDRAVADTYLRSIGKESIDELSEDEYSELEQAIGIAHNHM